MVISYSLQCKYLEAFKILLSIVKLWNVKSEVLNWIPIELLMHFNSLSPSIYLSLLFPFFRHHFLSIYLSVLSTFFFSHFSVLFYLFFSFPSFILSLSLSYHSTSFSLSLQSISFYISPHSLAQQAYIQDSIKDILH